MRIARVVILFLLVALLTSQMSQRISVLDSASADGVEASDTTGSWSEFRGNLNNTGYSISRVPSRNGSFLRFDARFQVRSSPVLSDGVLYFGSDYGRVYAVNISTKKEVWNLTTGSEIWASALVVDDKVFVGSSDNNFYAIDRHSGIPVWTFLTGDDIHSSAKHVNGTIVLGSLDGNLYFLDAETGNETAPHFAANGGIYGTPAIVDGTAVIGSNDGNVYRVWLENGSMMWNFTLSPAFGENVKYSSAAVFEDKVYIGSNDRNSYCLSLETGELIWRFETGDYVYASPAIHDSRVFVHSTDGFLSALPLEDPNGNGNISTDEVLWSFQTHDGGGRGEGGSSPAVADGKVIVGSRLSFMEGYVYVLEEDTGNLTWQLKLQGMYSSPAIVDGRIFIGASDGYMHGISELAPGMALEIEPEVLVIKSERLMVIEFVLTYAGEPVEGAFIQFEVTEGILSQSGASTLADGVQVVKYLSPVVTENTTVTITGKATKYGMVDATFSLDIVIVPAKDYEDTASGAAFSLDKYMPFIIAISILVILNLLILTAIIVRKGRSSD